MIGGLFDDIMEVGSDIFDAADDATLGVVRKVTPRTIQKPLDGEELTATDVVADVAEAALAAEILDILSDD